MKRIILFLGVILLLFALMVGCGPSGTSVPVIISFFANPTIIDEGDNSTLAWEVSGAVSVMITPEVSSVGLAGNFVVSPSETTTYTLTATNTAGSTTANVKVTVNTAMQKAIDVVIEEILPEIPEIKSGEPYWCVKLDSPLPPGAIILEDSGTAAKSRLKITLEEEKFFFFLDLAPGSFYKHPVKYILVDQEGNHEEHDALWWPKINDVVPEVILKEVPEENDVISTNVSLVAAVGTISDYLFPALASVWSEGFIVVQGLMPTESLYNCAVNTYLNGVNFFNAYKSAFSRVEGLVQTDARQVLDTIDQMVEEGKDVITIYIIAHGGVDSIRLGGQYFYASQFRNKMSANSGVVFNFILGSCHSGSFIDNLSSLENVCVVETACSSDEGAYGDKDVISSFNDYNPLDVGSEWTSSLIEAMFNITQDSTKMDKIKTWASNDEVPVTCMLIYQAGYGALGYQLGLSLVNNLDLTNVVGLSTPNHYYCREIVY
ncbi:MAG: C13 family peptidase [Candidatus Caldatribacteriota bacterium]|nr:C13 family peptidase [Candidatus Caldatribacteriota bacterium]